MVFEAKCLKFLEDCSSKKSSVKYLCILEIF